MSNFEIGFCDKREFYEGFADRLNPLTLVKSHKYLFFAALDSETEGKSAIKMDSEILCVTELTDDIAIVDFGLEVPGISDGLKLQGTFQEKSLAIPECGTTEVGEMAITAAYFASKNQDIDEEFSKLIKGQLPANVH